MEIYNKLQSDIYSFGYEQWMKIGVTDNWAHILNSIVLLIALFILLLILDRILRKVVLMLLIKAIRKSKTRIDDYLIRNGVLKNAIHIFPLLLAKYSIPLIFTGFPQWTNISMKIVNVIIIWSITMLIKSITLSFKDLLRLRKKYIDKPLDSYFQVVTILLYIICGILSFTHLLGVSPRSVLGGLGAASAIVLLVFKDTILGFVASIQVSSNDMVRVGDWIEMSKYGADGDVVEINLSTVKVQNFDKTITTIPTYALISDSFKNYRGMRKAGGRRIKRSIHIKMGSIRFLKQEEIENLKRVKLLKSYIIERQKEIDEYNYTHVDDPTMLVNGRRMTNVGLFREYIKRYLLNNPKTNKSFSLMVRHLQPTEHGLPIEIYTFANTTVWAEYEGIMADIFDHVFAVVPYFHLEIYESPASDDLREIIHNLPNNKGS